VGPLRDFVIGLIAAAGLISALLSLVTTRWDEVSRTVRIRRSLFISLLLVLGLVAAIASIPQKAEPVPPPPTIGSTETTHTVAPTTDPTPAPATSDTTPTTATHAAPPPPVPVPRREPVVIRDARGASIADLVDVAYRLVDTKRFRVEATMTSRSKVEDDARLQGMVTTDVALDVHITTLAGAHAKSFTLTARAATFDEHTSMRDAQKALAAAFEERLTREGLR
jgi:hypothetical protein